VRRGIRKTVSIVLTLLLGSFLVYRIHHELESVRVISIRYDYLLIVFFLGLTAYLVYTLVWYVLLQGIRKTPYRQLLELNLMNSYLAMTLNSALGNIVKAKYALNDWWASLAVISMISTFEILPGMVVGFLMGDLSMLPFLGLFLWAYVHPRSLYQALSRVFKSAGRLPWIESYYRGWIGARKKLLAGFSVSLLQPLLLSLALYLTVRAFGFSVEYPRTLLAVTYSTVIGGAIGTPGGIGGNELGIILAIGDVPAGATIAFVFKLLTQYVYAIFGAVPFYRLAAGRSLAKRL